MSTALSHDVEANRDHLTELRDAGAVNEVNPLALGVEAAVEALEPLTAVEYGILWNGITEDTLAFIRQHPELLIWPKVCAC